MLTIIFAAGVGVAVVLYAARPRHNGASSISAVVGPSAVGSFNPSEMVQAAPMPQVTAVETPVAVTPSPEAQAPAEVALVVADVATAGLIEPSPAATPVTDPSSAAPASIAETVKTPAQSGASTRRAQGKRSTATKSRAKSTRRVKTS